MIKVIPKNIHLNSLIDITFSTEFSNQYELVVLNKEQVIAIYQNFHRYSIWF